MVICSVHSNAFTCTSEDMLTCTLSDSGVVRDQSIIPPASSAEDNVNFVDDDDVPSLDEPGSYLTATTFYPLVQNVMNWKTLSRALDQLKN